jgi:hypothetical protein
VDSWKHLPFEYLLMCGTPASCYRMFLEGTGWQYTLHDSKYLISCPFHFGLRIFGHIEKNNSKHFVQVLSYPFFKEVRCPNHSPNRADLSRLSQHGNREEENLNSNAEPLDPSMSYHSNVTSMIYHCNARDVSGSPRQLAAELATWYNTHPHSKISSFEGGVWRARSHPAVIGGE